MEPDEKPAVQIWRYLSFNRRRQAHNFALVSTSFRPAVISAETETVRIYSHVWHIIKTFVKFAKFQTEADGKELLALASLLGA